MVRPDPIPNSAVKHSLADGSSPIGSARVGSRQFFNKNPGENSPGFLLKDWRRPALVKSMPKEVEDCLLNGRQMFKLMDCAR